jgi:hypothetical protein
VLVFGRNKPSQNHRQRVLDELGESYGHLRLAAGHAADGAAERMAPSYDRARELAVRRMGTTASTLTPLYEQMMQGAAKARKENKKVSKRKWPMLVGLLAAGATAGAAGAMVARRRRAAAQWDEYEPLPSIDDMSYRGEGGTVGATQKVKAGAASMADSVSASAGKIAESLHEKSGPGRHGTSDPAASPDRSHQGTGTFTPFAEDAESTNGKNARP